CAGYDYTKKKTIKLDQTAWDVFTDNPTSKTIGGNSLPGVETISGVSFASGTWNAIGWTPPTDIARNVPFRIFMGTYGESAEVNWTEVYSADSWVTAGILSGLKQSTGI